MRHSRALSAGHLPRQRRLWARLSLGSSRAMLAMTAGMTVVGLVGAACSSTGSSGPPAGGTPIRGGTAVFAELPSTQPNYIFPFTSSSFISIVNLNDFAYLMYRPLYWFGSGTQPTNNPSLSLANPPTFSGRNVTITLKHYMWSNGTPVTAQNVMFWINMMRAVPQDWGAFVPGGFPTNVTNIKAVSPTELTMTMNKSFSPRWFLYNELSQITPMPTAWDRTAAGPSHCTTTVKDCAAVYNYLNAQAKNLSGYVGSPLWSIVDGPWKLKAFNADGHVTFVPNRSYSGPVKPKLAAFEEVPFTTDAAEYNVLQAPSGATKINVGYIPTQDAPAKPAGAVTGPNPLSSKGYTLDPWYSWGISYYAENTRSSLGDHGAIIKQLYFRQALAYMMNQAAVISGPLRGYGQPTVGPVGTFPSTSFLSPQGKAGDPFPYNPSKAKSLLTSNGWKVNPGGVSTCVKPGTAAGHCGKGITAVSGLSFTMTYANGQQWIAQEMQQLQSNASTIGIKLSLVPKPFSQVTAQSAGNCVVAKIPCGWDFGDWGLGWSFAPDYYPSGETLFTTGSVANSSGYTDPKNDSMINQTLTNGSAQVLYNWQDYLAKQLPLEWQPNAPYQLTEISSNLRGVLPQNPTLTIYPENWYFVK
ncbi:MAG TPA: ABC transporter substrate-binding protein [Streptosporangiaceae bacterium]|nr:ABC transporter substrate-binding protein [Streptosporangiaceae bacterium]